MPRGFGPPAAKAHIGARGEYSRLSGDIFAATIKFAI
jgi:hypothetical protein